MKRWSRSVLLSIMLIAIFLGKAGVWGEELYEIRMQIPYEAPGMWEVEEAVNEKIGQELGVKLTFVPTTAPTFDASLAIAAREKLDLVLSLFGGMPDLVREGYLLPLDDYLQEGSGKQIREICGEQLGGGRYQGKVYGFPTFYVDAHTYGFLCRKDLMEKYGLTLPEGQMISPEQLESFFDQVKAGEGESFYILGGSMLYLDLLMHCFFSFDSLGLGVETGVLLDDRIEGKLPQVVNLYATQEFASFAQRMRRWQQKGFFKPGSSTSEESCNALVRRGEILGWFFYNVPGEEVENTSDSERDMVFIPMQEPMRMTEACQDVLWSIPVTCEQPQKVVDFMEKLYTDAELINLLQRGIEGRSYVVTEEGKRGKQISLPEGETVFSIPYYTNLGLYGNRRLDYTWAPGEADRIDRIEAFCEGVTRTSPAFGYCFDQEPVQAAYLAVKEVVGSWNGLLATGEVDPEKGIPDLLEELEAAGIGEILAENQRQLTAWMEEAKRRPAS